MITQEIPISLLMDPQKMLIFRKGDYGNQIKIKFPDLTGITSAEFRFIKPDDTFVVSTGEIVENDIIITITQQMSLLSGCGIFNLRLINSQSNIYTYVGRALIDDNINLDDYAASVAEVNGLVFPDDFLTSADLSQYATKTYVNEAVAEVPIYTPPNYSTTEQNTGLKWVDGKDIYQRTFIPNLTLSTSWQAVADMTGIDWVTGIEYNITRDGEQAQPEFGGSDHVSWFVRNGYLQFSNNVTSSSASVLVLKDVTIKYTKTTDTV